MLGAIVSSLALSQASTELVLVLDSELSVADGSHCRSDRRSASPVGAVLDLDRGAEAPSTYMSTVCASPAGSCS